MSASRLILGIACLVIAAAIAILGSTPYRFMIGAVNMSVYPAIALALLGCVIIGRQIARYYAR